MLRHPEEKKKNNNNRNVLFEINSTFEVLTAWLSYCT